MLKPSTETDKMAVELMQVCLMAGWNYSHSDQVLLEASKLAKTAKLKRKCFVTENGQVDVAPTGYAIVDNARIVAQCMMQWGASYETAIDVLEMCRKFCFVKFLADGFVNDSGVSMKQSPPEDTRIIDNEN